MEQKKKKNTRSTVANHRKQQNDQYKIEESDITFYQSVIQRATVIYSNDSFSKV